MGGVLAVTGWRIERLTLTSNSSVYSATFSILSPIYR